MGAQACRAVPLRVLREPCYFRLAMSIRWTSLAISFALALGLLVSAACGPSSGQVKTARTASYKTDSDTVFRAMVQVVGKKYKVINADAASGMLRTEDRWYEKDGTYEDKKANDGIIVEDGSVVMYYLVKLAGGPTEYKVEVIPFVAQMRAGYAAPVKLEPDDMQIPGWVQGKTDDLYVGIYEALKPYAVSPGG
jgi:hypothetical protein